MAISTPPAPPPFAPLLNHEARNINGLIIPAESEIKDVPLLFYYNFLTDGVLILHHPGTDGGIFATADTERRKKEAQHVFCDGCQSCIAQPADSLSALNDDCPQRGPLWLLPAVVLITKTSRGSQVPSPTQINRRRVVRQWHLRGAIKISV